jgi:hypothetical protein
MAPDSIVVLASGLNGHLRLAQAVEELPPQPLVAELAVEALAIAVLPGRAPLDLGRLGPDPRDPTLVRLGHEPTPSSRQP